jgi:hypothetical protein
MRALVLLAFAAAAAGDAREEAWFAFRAAELGNKEAVPRLVEALGKEPGARRWILDALIRLEGEVPAEGVEGLFEEFPAETLILLSRDPEKNEQRLAAIAEMATKNRHYLHWVAACNLLVARKSKSLAAPLLRDLELRLDVRVTDPDVRVGKGNSRMRFAGLVRGSCDPQCPPTPRYALTLEQGKGAVPVALGRRTVFFVRSLPQPDEHGFVGSDPRSISGMRDEVRLEYLAELLGVEPSNLGLIADGLVSVPWRGVEAYAGEIAAARARVEAAHRDLVAKLVERKLLNPRDAPRAPQVKVTVTDQRTDKSVALPALEGVEMKSD